MVKQARMSRKTGDTDKLTDITGKSPKRVLIAEDSATIRYHLVHLLNEMPGIDVIGEARDGEEAVRMTAEMQPDVVSMDIRMPRMDGLEATRRIMAQTPTPVVIVSGLVQTDVDLSFQAIQSGALAVVEKPPDRKDPTFDSKQKHLAKTLAAMASVSVVRRALGVEKAANGPAPVAVKTEDKPRVLVIGASAGGPSALSVLIRMLPKDLSIPVVVVQHIPTEFTSGLVRWLNKLGTMRTEIVSDNRVLQPGVVHLSPGNAHITIAESGSQLAARLIKEQGDERYQPSVDMLFQSVADVCGSRAIGVILTGMGDDGAAGLLEMYKAGARTFAQDEASATVYGMPGAAVACGAVERVLSLTDLPTAISKLV